MAAQCGAADGVSARVGGVLRGATVADAAQGCAALAVDPARDHAQAIAAGEGLGIEGFAGVVEAHVERGGFAVNGVFAIAQGGGVVVVAGLFVAVVAVVAGGDAQAGAARHRTGVQRGTGARNHVDRTAADEADVAATAGARVGGLARDEHDGSVGGVVGGEALAEGEIGVGAEVDRAARQIHRTADAQVAAAARDRGRQVARA